MLCLRTMLLPSIRTSRFLSVNTQQIDCNILFIWNVMIKNYSTKDNDQGDTKSENNPQIPDPPTTCCMGGCSNCVWLEYAEKLTKIFADSGEKSQEIILKNVSDENMKAFLMMELRTLRNRMKDNGNNDK